MTARLNIVLDQVVAPTDAGWESASGEIARSLVATAPSGCEVAAIVPAAGDVAAVVEREVPGLADIVRAGLPRRELAAAWQLGMPAGSPGGMIHAPTPMAPLVRHDRVHDHDQTVVTMWDLAAWERPHELGRAAVAWHKDMLKRAARFADAVVVPTHSAAERLGEIVDLGDRVRVIFGAAPEQFRVPTDEVGRRRALGVPDGCLLISGSAEPSTRLEAALGAVARAGADLPVVVIDAGEDDGPRIAEMAEAAGLDSGRVQVCGVSDLSDRAALMAGAVALIAPSLQTAFPWRVVEALRLGVPVVAAGSAVHREVVLDGGLIADADDDEALAAALESALASADVALRLATLAADRGRAFSWIGAAERVWQLHADL